MKLLFVGRKFGGVAGGLERIAIQLINAMATRGHQVNLLTLDQPDAQVHYPMELAVDWHKVAIGNPARKASWAQRLLRHRRMRTIVKQVTPDVILAFEHGTFLSIRLATLGLGIPVIAAERNAPQRFRFQRARYYRSLIYFSYLLAHRVTIQFDSYRKHYPTYLQHRILTIPNPVARADGHAHPAADSRGRKTLLYVGHLTYQKNPSVLLRAFGILASEFPTWELQMAGQGEERDSLKELAAELGLTSRVHFLGIVKNVEALYQDAHLFCLPARWEGFPNALAEALAHGLPAVGFAGCAGLNELVEDGKNGLLAPGNEDPAALAAVLRALMASADLRKRMGEAAINSMRGFEKNSIFDRWEALFKDVAYKGKM